MRRLSHQILYVLGTMIFLSTLGCGEESTASVDTSKQEGEACGDNTDCVGGLLCDDGVCAAICISECSRACGDDGCGGSCGTCPDSAPFCTQNGCSAECIPDCAARACGDDGCGGSCGQCTSAMPFCSDGQCVQDCDPACDGRSCGADGCGGECGTCEAPLVCQTSTGACATAPGENVTLVGQVVATQDGAPLADVTVSSEDLSAVTDSSGRFEINGLPTGTVEVVATKDLYMEYRAQIFAVSGENPLRIELRGESRIVGTVLSSDSMNPIDAEVSLGFTSSATGPNGSYSLDGLVPGTFTVEFTANGFQTHRESVTLSSGEETTVDVLLEPAGKVVGVVEDENGMRLSDVLVSTDVNIALSDATGSYELTGLSSGSVEVIYAKNGFDPLVRDVNIMSGAPTTANVTMAIGGTGTFRGTVIGANSGQPVANAQVLLSGPSSPSFTTSSDGEFEFIDIPAGLYTASVWGDTIVNKSNIQILINTGGVKVESITVKETQSCAVQTIDGSTGLGLSVQYSVRWSDPALGYPNSFVGSSFTDANGLGLTTCASNAINTFQTFPQNYHAPTLQFMVTPDNQSFQIPHTPHGLISGRVRDSSGGNIDDASVSLLDLNGTVLTSTITAADGSFEITSATSGSATIYVSKPGFTNAARSITLPRTGQISVDIELNAP